MLPWFDVPVLWHDAPGERPDGEPASAASRLTIQMCRQLDQRMSAPVGLIGGICSIVKDKFLASQSRSACSRERRRVFVERIADAQLAALGGTMADTVGQSHRQRLVWLSMLAMPLLFPVALPGMASAVGAFCLFIALGLCLGQPVPLPRWLAQRELNGRAVTVLKRAVDRVVGVVARLGRPRMLALSNRPARVANGVMLSLAGLSMMVPVPIISFDNVLPALAIVLISWGLRLRDGLMLLTGHLVTLAALASVALLWWGGARLATEMISRVAQFLPW